MVVGLNLCPFSSGVIAQDQVHYAICDATRDTDLKQFYVTELERLLDADEMTLPRAYLYLPKALKYLMITLIYWIGLSNY